MSDTAQDRSNKWFRRAWIALLIIAAIPIALPYVGYGLYNSCDSTDTERGTYNTTVVAPAEENVPWYELPMLNAPEDDNPLGIPSARAAKEARDVELALDAETGFCDTLGAVAIHSVGRDLYYALDRKYNNPQQEGFEVGYWLERSSVSASSYSEFSGVRSAGEALALQNQLHIDQRSERILRAKGAGGLAWLPFILMFCAIAAIILLVVQAVVKMRSSK